MGALFGILLLLGVVVLYGVGGRDRPTVALLTDAHRGLLRRQWPSGWSLVLMGLMFEAGGVPAHYWVPDAAQGSSGMWPRPT